MTSQLSLGTLLCSLFLLFSLASANPTTTAKTPISAQPTLAVQPVSSDSSNSSLNKPQVQPPLTSVGQSDALPHLTPLIGVAQDNSTTQTSPVANGQSKLPTLPANGAASVTH